MKNACKTRGKDDEHARFMGDSRNETRLFCERIFHDNFRAVASHESSSSCAGTLARGNVTANIFSTRGRMCQKLFLRDLRSREENISRQFADSPKMPSRVSQTAPLEAL
jgi:hypothetical protein